MTTVWVTKWALTRGVLEWETEYDLQGIGLRALIGANGRRDPDWGVEEQTLWPGEWHRTRFLAVLKARLMRVSKLASHRRAIAKLEAMTFEVGE